MARELERVGIPTALITAMISVAQSVGTPRIVAANAIIHPTGNPGLPVAEEHAARLRLTELALRAVATPVNGPHVFSLDDPGGAAVTSLFLH